MLRCDGFAILKPESHTGNDERHGQEKNDFADANPSFANDFFGDKEFRVTFFVPRADCYKADRDSDENQRREA